MEKDIFINGIRYTPKITKNNKPISPITRMFLSMKSFYSNNKYDNINITIEYELIKNKESKLSANARAWVVNTFERYYEIYKKKSPENL